MKHKIGVIVYPGSNSDHDAWYVCEKLLGQKTKLHWHEDSFTIQDYDLVILPGGFSYGDYLRAGAMARFSPATLSLEAFSKQGGYVLGICNGFQILTEAGLLEGVLTKNTDCTFHSEDVHVKLENKSHTPFLSHVYQEVLKLPIAHSMGSFNAKSEVIKKLEDNGQVVMRYCDENANVTKESNINGSINNIAGVVNEKGNVMGLMPHPERSAQKILRNDDGMAIFASIAKKLWNL